MYQHSCLLCKPQQGYIFLTSSALGATWRVWLEYTGSVPTASSTICAIPATCWGGTVRSTLSSEWSPKSRQPGIGCGRGLRVMCSALTSRVNCTSLQGEGVLSCWCQESGGQGCVCRSRGSTRPTLEVWRPGR